jgi:hypothetical protein
MAGISTTPLGRRYPVLRAKTIHFPGLNRDPLDLVERDFVAGAVVELGCARVPDSLT